MTTTEKLKPCSCCQSPAEIVPGAKRNTHLAQCSRRNKCNAWPMTHPATSSPGAAIAWNRGLFLK